jgi:anti-sigma factor RsiW
MTRNYCATATEEEIDAWVNGELPDADVERVLLVVMTDPAAAATLDDCLQLRALGLRLRDGASVELEARSDVASVELETQTAAGNRRVRSLRAV